MFVLQSKLLENSKKLFLFRYNSFFSLSENTFTSQFWFKTAYPIKNYTEANILLPLIFPFSYLNFAFQGFVLAIIQIPKE